MPKKSETVQKRLFFKLSWGPWGQETLFGLSRVSGPEGPANYEGSLPLGGEGRFAKHRGLLVGDNFWRVTVRESDFPRASGNSLDFQIFPDLAPRSSLATSPELLSLWML